MIQFNLLPDVKLEYIKVQRTKRLVTLVSVLIGSVALAVFLVMFSLVNFSQTHHLSNLQKDIDADKKTLQSQENLAKILTIQNQLNTLPGLHDQKPVTSRVIGYTQQLTPSGANISKLDVRWEENTISVEGSADSLAVVNTFVDTLKFTKAEVQKANDESSSPETKAPFSEVVLQTFAVGTPGSGKKPVTYTINFKYDPVIFSSDYTVNLSVNGKQQ